MSFIEWDQSYSVSIKLIDNQHKKLFALINDFHDTKTNLDEVLQDLLSYIDFHFKTEEKYFDKFHYEKEESHKKQHKFYEDKIRELYSRCMLEKIDESKISTETEGFIKDWIVNHIKVSDKEYTNCFQQHGLV